MTYNYWLPIGLSKYDGIQQTRFIHLLLDYWPVGTPWGSKKKSRQRTIKSRKKTTVNSTSLYLNYILSGLTLSVGWICL
jgi:hypothetical protein